MTITYLTGDATAPERAGLTGPFVIAHIVNDQGVWARGFVRALSARDPGPERDYRARKKPLMRDGAPWGYELGRVMWSRYRESDWVASMICQVGVDAARHVDLRALEVSLREVMRVANFGAGLTLALPRIGTGLGRATWADVEPLLERVTTAASVTAHVFDLPAGSAR